MAQWVIPDIHGCSKTLQALLDRAGINSGDTVYFLGDYVDRGPDARGVIDCIIGLPSQGIHIHPLLGNHEEVLMDLRTRKPGFFSRLLKRKSTLEQDWIYFGGEATLVSFGVSELAEIPGFYWKWFSELSHYTEALNFYLVHAGFNFQRKDFLADKHAMLWIRKFQPDPVALNSKAVVHGHVPTPLARIRALADHPGSLRIPLDNGCVYKFAPDMGNLLAFELETRQLVVQPNIDF